MSEKSDKILSLDEWQKEQDHIILAEDRLIGARFSIFKGGVKVSPFIRPKVVETEGIPCLAETEKGYRIEFECAGVGAPAFFAEFLKLVDKYNHLEQSVYMRPEPPKKKRRWWEKFWKRS